jgi:hypothetical protein
LAFDQSTNSSFFAGQDESQVEKEESSQTEAQEKKDESQIVSSLSAFRNARALCID